MKHLAYFLTAAAVSLFLSNCSEVEPGKVRGVHLSGGAAPTLLNSRGEPFTAKGIVYYQPKAAHHYFLENIDLDRVPADLQKFRQDGFNTIYITVNWGEIFNNVDPENNCMPTSLNKKRIDTLKKLLRLIHDANYYVYLAPAVEIVPPEINAAKYPAVTNNAGIVLSAFKGYFIHNWLVDNNVNNGFLEFLRFFSKITAPYDNVVAYILPYEMMNLQWPWCQKDKKITEKWREWLHDKNPDINYWKKRWNAADSGWNSISDIPLPIHNRSYWQEYLKVNKIKPVEPDPLVWRDCWEFMVIGIANQGRYGLSFKQICDAIRTNDTDALIVSKSFTPKRMAWELGCLDEWQNNNTPPDAKKILDTIYSQPGVSIMACEGYPAATTNLNDRASELSFKYKVEEYEMLRKATSLPIYCQEFGINHHEWTPDECALYLKNAVAEYQRLGVLGYNLWQSGDFIGGGTWDEIQPNFGIYNKQGKPYPAVKAIRPLLRKQE